MKNLKKHLSNIVGNKVKGRYIIFESDDWGSIRMPNKKTLNNILKDGDLLNGFNYRMNNNDSLANTSDLKSLFDVLTKYTDCKGRNPVFSALSTTCNPDFEAIEANGYENYVCEPFTHTLKKYGIEDVFKCWKLGLKERLFVPQFHGREHLNVPLWMRMLRRKDKNTLKAFKYKFWGYEAQLPYNMSYQAAYDIETPSDNIDHSKTIEDGLKIFKKIHGYSATYFVPPNGPFNSNLENVAAEHGIKYIGASKIQRESVGYGKSKVKFHWLGQKNTNGQCYITRNVFFEPNTKDKDWVNSCLNEINVAFKWNKPAVISTHRCNYIGSLNPKNRENTLRLFDELLNRMLKIWPDIQFITSEELGNLISSDRNTSES